MITYGGMEEQLHASYISVLDGSEWSASLPGHFILREGASRYPLGRMLSGPQSQSGHGNEKIPFLAPAGS